MALSKEELAEQKRLKSEIAQEAIDAFGLSPDEAADISIVERIAAKATGANPQEQMNYIKRERPDLDVVLHDGEVYAKKAGSEEKYKAMDPEFSPWSSPISTLKDLPQDAADLIYDVPAGLIQGAATVAGAAPGAALLNPPLAVAGASAASAASGAGLEFLKQGLGRVLGVNKNFDGGQILMSGGTGLVAPGAGVALSKVARGTGGLYNAAARKMSQFTKGEANQYLKNGKSVKEAVDLLSDSGNLDVVQKKAHDSINKIRMTLASAGKNADKEVKDLLEGKKIDVNLSSIKNKLDPIMNNLPEEEANKLRSLIGELESTYKAYGPMEDVNYNQQMVEAVQPSMEIKKATDTVSGEVEAQIPESSNLFDGVGGIESVSKPQEYATAQQIANEFGIPLKDAEMALTSGQLKNALQQNSMPFEKVVQTSKPYTFVRPAVPYTETKYYGRNMVQPSLPMQAMEENAVALDANKARELRQLLQKAAKYGSKENMSTGKSSGPASKDIERLAGSLNDKLNEVPGVKDLTGSMQSGIQLQKTLAQKEFKPIAFLKTGAEDDMATIAAAAKKTGSKEVYDLKDQLSAARKIIGKGDSDDWTTRGAMRMGGRAGLQVGDFASKLGLTKAPEVSGRRGQMLWLELMNELNKENGDSI